MIFPSLAELTNLLYVFFKATRSQGRQSPPQAARSGRVRQQLDHWLRANVRCGQGSEQPIPQPQGFTVVLGLARMSGELVVIIVVRHTGTAEQAFERDNIEYDMVQTTVIENVLGSPQSHKQVERERVRPSHHRAGHHWQTSLKECIQRIDESRAHRRWASANRGAGCGISCIAAAIHVESCGPSTTQSHSRRT